MTVTLSPLVLNPRGTSRIVSLEEACRHMWAGFSRENDAVYRTPEERAASMDSTGERPGRRRDGLLGTGGNGIRLEVFEMFGNIIIIHNQAPPRGGS